jgi:16S rRNA processing protein RimM
VPDADAPLVAIGEVLRPYGVRGEVAVRPLTDWPRERFRRLETCFLWEPSRGRREPCRVVERTVTGDAVRVRIEGVDSPEAARALQGRLLAVEQAQALPPREGEFYPWQLAGATVETPDGRPLGRFVRVEDSPAQPLWVIERDGREWMLPAVREFVLEVSVAERRIVASPPEGLDTL